MTKRLMRTLTPEELADWLAICQTIAPLPGRLAIETPVWKKSESQRLLEPTAADPEPPKVRENKVKPISRIDTRTRRRIARGAIKIDATLDLHGIIQAEVHRRLYQFLERERLKGSQVILVITGKGRVVDGESLGLLRRLVPILLEGTAFRELITGFEQAAPQHGGSGALYVRIRKLAS